MNNQGRGRCRNKIPTTFGVAAIFIAGMARSYAARLSLVVVGLIGLFTWNIRCPGGQNKYFAAQKGAALRNSGWPPNKELIRNGGC